MKPHAPDCLRDSPLRDTEARLGAAAAGEALPEWDLRDLYAGPEDPRLKADLEAAERSARAFEAAHAGRLGSMSGDALEAALREYERIEEVLGRAMSYAQLLFSGDAQDAGNGRFYQTMQERVTVIGSHLLFFTLELNRLDDAFLEGRMAGSLPSRARRWMRRCASTSGSRRCWGA